MPQPELFHFYFKIAFRNLEVESCFKTTTSLFSRNSSSYINKFKRGAILIFKLNGTLYVEMELLLWHNKQ